MQFEAASLFISTFESFMMFIPFFFHLMVAVGTPYPTHVSREVVFATTLSLSLNTITCAGTTQWIRKSTLAES